MKPFFLLVPLLLTFAACSGDKPVDHSTDSPRYESIMPPPDSIHEEHGMPEVTTECYRFDKGEHHKWIELTQVLDSAWGTLHFNWDGKDGANGDFTGKFHGDTLWIIFNAKGEGFLIPREVAFLKKGDKLYEAQGTQEEGPKGIYYYQYKKMLEYSDPEPMTKGPCM